MKKLAFMNTISRSAHRMAFKLQKHSPEILKVKFNDRGPQVYLVSGGAHRHLDEELVSMIDEIDIRSVNLDVRPYDWEVNSKTGRTAYLQSMEVIQEIDRFAARYAEEESPEE